MSRIIAFAETTEALLAGAKTVTRRDWKPQYARTFTAGEVLQAWDKNPRTKRGRRIGTIRLTAAPVWEEGPPPPADFAAEGFVYMVEHGLTLFGGAAPGDVWNAWSTPGSPGRWVVRFEVIGRV